MARNACVPLAVLAFGLVFFLATSALGATCGACQNDNDCSDPSCTRCISGQCTAGLPCYSSCNLTADCDQSGSCKICRLNECVDDGSCGSVCQSPDDCYAGTCKDCVNGLCVSLCGGTCQANSDCSISNSTCAFCIEGFCQVGGCGSQCGTNSDCAGQGNCTSCIYNRCTIPCGGACGANNQCNGAYTGCGLCTGGVCVPGDVCGQTCANNNQCSGSCTRCNSVGQCDKGYPCYASCQVDTDCAQGPSSCSQCIGGACMAPADSKIANNLNSPVRIN